MAKVLHGTLAGSVSGSVGSETYSRNRYGAYVRNRAKPVIPVTEYVLNAKARMSGQSSRWNAVNADSRVAWTTWAQTNPIVDRLGQSQTLTGHAAFVGLNSRLDFAGVSTIDVPPILAAPPALTSLTATFDAGAGDFELNFTPTPIGSNLRIWVQAAVVDRVSINYVKNLLKNILVSPANQTTGLDIQAAVITRFGGLSIGQKVVVMASVFDDRTGLLSVPRMVSGLVTST
jgi:hypothetical protein